jgi:hypothetical protein
MQSMRDLFRVSKHTRLLGVIAVLAVFVGIFRFYMPSFSYWAYQHGGGRVELAGSLTIKMADGWYPVVVSERSSGSYVLFVRINPLFPSRDNISNLAMWKRAQAPSPNWLDDRSGKLERFGWGEAVVQGRQKTAVIANSGLLVMFDDRRDLNDIVALEKK